jgi:hypothetical protein
LGENVVSALYVIVSVLFAIYLVLRIGRMLGGRSVTVMGRESGPQPHATFDPNRFNTAPLPKRTDEEIKAHDETLQMEWVTYNGRTPPLRLKLRGNTYEGFRRVIRKYIDIVGQDHFDGLSHAERMQLMPLFIAEAYVIEWEGAQYPNGAPMPYSPANLALFMAGDQHLIVFADQESQRISPPWPTG